MQSSIFEEWEPVIGLETHVRLLTESKLFSPAPNQFGQEPNTNISHVCTGQPGALPLLNKVAVFKSVQFGLAVNAQIALRSEFDRKSFFYPDNPRNYQITQYYHPLLIGGEIEAQVNGVTKRFQITRAHLEDDSGTIEHFSSFAGIDFNRAGVPLLEIVSAPCMHSAEEASAYAQKVRSILAYLEISNCNMEESSLLFDVNVSVRKKGEQALRDRVEIKNLNSFHSLEAAIRAEFKRQVTLYSSTPEKNHVGLIKFGTYRFDTEKNEVIMMRYKESAEDYRYFPEPDLLPLLLTQEYIQQVRATLPVLPQQK